MSLIMSLLMSLIMSLEGLRHCECRQRSQVLGLYRGDRGGPRGVSRPPAEDDPGRHVREVLEHQVTGETMAVRARVEVPSEVSIKLFLSSSLSSSISLLILSPFSIPSLSRSLSPVITLLILSFPPFLIFLSLHSLHPLLPPFIPPSTAPLLPSSLHFLLPLRTSYWWQWASWTAP